MSKNEIIENYVSSILKHVPSKEREDIGAELHGLLAEMVEDKEIELGHAPDSAAIGELLKNFGEPAEIAARYSPSTKLIIPASETLAFSRWALGGVIVQWLLTFPQVFAGQSIGAWWLSWGLGAFWWPGFMVSMSIIRAWLPQTHNPKPKTDTKLFDTNYVNKNVMVFGLIWFAIGSIFMALLPWLGALMPSPFNAIFAFDPEFLASRAVFAVILWTAGFLLRIQVLNNGRWSKAQRQIDGAINALWVLLLIWWVSAGKIFLAAATDNGAKSALVFTIIIVLISMAYEYFKLRVNYKLHQA